MRLIVLALVTIVLTACATDSPYRDKSPMFISGVEATPLQGGEIKVTSTGAGQDRPQLLAAWAMRKSAEETLARGRTHFQVTTVRFGSTTTSVAGMSAGLPLVELVILPLENSASGKGVYDAATVKRDAEAFAAAGMKDVPPGLLPVAVEKTAVVDKS